VGGVTRWGARRGRYRYEAMTAVTDVDDDWLLTRELRSSLRSTGVGSNASTQQHDRYMLRDGSVATAIRSGHRIHRSVYRQHKDTDDSGTKTVALNELQ